MPSCTVARAHDPGRCDQHAPGNPGREDVAGRGTASLRLTERNALQTGMRELPGDAPRGYLLVSVVLSDLPAFSITFRMNSYCVWTSRSAICIAESTISSRLDGPSPCAGSALSTLSANLRTTSIAAR
jgi:hypothetical protein